MKVAYLLFLFGTFFSFVLAEDRPDVVMIAVDDLRPMLGCYGDPHGKSPHIDSLASRGVVFERAYCQYSKCGPSRLSLMTGLRPGTTKQYGHSEKVLAAFRESRPDVVSVARWFKGNGYETRSLGKIDHDTWQLDGDWSEPPFAGRDEEMLEIHDESNPSGPTIIADRWTCPVVQSPDVSDTHFFAGRMTEEALRIYGEKGDRPLFLAVGFRRPHLPFIAPKRYFDLHSPDDTWLAPNPDPPAASPFYSWFNSWSRRKKAISFGAEIPEDPAELMLPDWMVWNGSELRSYLGVPVQEALSIQQQLDLKRAYAACVSYVDAQIGRLLEEVDFENTIIVLWSDHGWHLGEHSAWAKITNFEVATRVPFIVAAPGVAPGSTKSITELIDLYPSLCELAGIEAPDHLEGKSFVNVLRDLAQVGDQIALSEIDREHLGYHGYAMRTNHHRIIQWRDRETGEVTAVEVYDQENDPDETRNIAGEEAQSSLVEVLTYRLESAFRLP